MELTSIEITLLECCSRVDPLNLMQVDKATKEVQGLTPNQLTLFKAHGELQVAGIAIALMSICPIDHDERQPFLAEYFTMGGVSRTRERKVRNVAKVILNDLALMLELGLNEDRARALVASLRPKGTTCPHAPSSPTPLLEGGEMLVEC